MKKNHPLKIYWGLLAFFIVFRINAQTVTIGSGTTQNGATVSSPINNYYDAHHCQMIYTAAEITAGGLSSAGTISQLGFYITVSPTNNLPNFTIKIKNTSSINASVYDGAGLTQVYNIASYAPVSGGYQMLTLSTPYVWDGVSNLLVDVCSDAAAANGGSGRLQIFTPSPAGTHYSYTRNDGVAQCGVATNADDGNFNDYGTKATKPQIRFVFTAAPGCIIPPLQPVGAITATGASISWLVPNPAPSTGYQWKIVAAGTGTAGVAIASGSPAVGTNSAVVTGLTANTSYDIYIRSNCGASVYSSYSTPVNFSTLCSAANIPYTLNLASVTTPAIPGCTSKEKLNTANDWITTPAPGNGFNGNTLAYNYNLSLPADAWFYTQGLNLTAGTSYRLTYKYANDGGTTYPEKMNIKYGASPSAASMSTLLADHPLISGAIVPLVNVVDFVPSSSGVYYVGFHAYSDANMNVLLLDSVSVKLSPACIEPTAITLSNITATGANISWTLPSGSPSGYNWDVRSSGTPGTAGAAANGTVTASTSSVAASGLTPSTTYSVYVRTNCGAGGFSAWTVATVFTTPCLATNIPYIMPIASAVVPGIPSCTSIQNLNAGNNWETVNNPGYGFNGNALVYNYNFSLPGDAWLYTQGLNLTAGTSYRLAYKYSNDGSSNPEKMNIKYGTSPSAASMSTLLADHPSITATTGPLVNFVDFTPSATGVYYVGFHAYSDANMYLLLLDSVSVKLSPSCIEPSAVTVNNITTSSAHVSWTAPSTTPASYNWDIRTSGTPGTAGAAASGTVTAPTISVTGSGLASGTTYSVYVRANCGAGGFSAWTVATVFTTPCIAANIPYTMDLLNATVPNIPSCTSVENAGSGNVWETVNNPGYGFTGNALLYPYNSVFAADTWIYTQGLNLTGGVAYKLAYRYNAAGTTYVEDMNVKYGTSPASASMTNLLINHNAISNNATPYTDAISFTPATSGVYYIGFHAYSAADQFNLYIDSIHVDLCIAPTLTLASSSASICSGQSATLTVSGATSYTWSTASNTNTIVVSPTANQTYTVTGVNACGTATASVMINVNPVTTLSVTASSQTLCAGQTATLTASGTATTFTWSNGSNTNTAVVSPTVTQLYTVSNVNACGTLTVATTISVTPLPTATLSASSQTLCTGQSATLTASGTTTSYTWSTGSNTNSIVVTPTVSQTYTVSASNVCGTANATQSITVNAVPVLTATASNTMACSGQSLTLTATGSASTYSWSSGGNTAVTTVSAAILTATTPVNSTYTVTGTNSCGSGTATVNVLVYPSPIMNASVNTATICSGKSATLSASGSPNYTWTAVSLLGPSIATTATTVVTPTTTTTYYVKGTYGGNCYGAALITVNVIICTGVEGITLSGNDISVYPNPNNGIMTVSIPDELTEHHVVIEVYDALGKVVIKESLNTGITTLNTSKLEDGIYIYKIHSGTQSIYIGKMIKQ